MSTWPSSGTAIRKTSTRFVSTKCFQGLLILNWFWILGSRDWKSLKKKQKCQQFQLPEFPIASQPSGKMAEVCGYDHVLVQQGQLLESARHLQCFDAVTRKLVCEASATSPQSKTVRAEMPKGTIDTLVDESC